MPNLGHCSQRRARGADRRGALPPPPQPRRAEQQAAVQQQLGARRRAPYRLARRERQACRRDGPGARRAETQLHTA